MSLQFTTADLARLEDCNRALLNPLAAPDAVTWLTGAAETVRLLVGGDLALFSPPAGERYEAFCPQNAGLAQAVSSIASAVLEDRMYFHDPVLNAWSSHGGRIPVSSYASNRRIIEPLGYRMEESMFTDAACRPHGLSDFVSLHLMEYRSASIIVLNERGRPQSFGEEAAAMLGLLAPSFRTGLDMLTRVQAPRMALDALQEPLVTLDADGREQYRNPALVGLLDADPERTLIEGALWQLGRRLRRLAFPRRFEMAAPPPLLQQEVATAYARYTLRAALLPPGALGPGETALITVAAERAPRPLSPEEVRARLGLTAREAEVAILLAEGLSNREIADRLFVAPGTAKRHVEGIFAKLGVSTRAAVAGRLLQSGPAA